MIFVAQERLSIPAAITVSPAFTDTSIDALRANYTHRLSRKNFLSPVGEFFPTAVVRSALFRIVGFLFADLVNIPPHFLFEIPPQSDMRVPFFLRIEAITPFDVQHPLFYVKHALRSGNTVAQLNQPVVIIVNRFFQLCPDQGQLVLRNVIFSDIFLQRLRRKGMRRYFEEKKRKETS